MMFRNYEQPETWSLSAKGQKVMLIINHIWKRLRNLDEKLNAHYSMSKP